MSLFEELKRRNVVRMAMLYVVGSWLVLQVADVLFGVLDLPVSAIRFVLAVLVLGFPVVLLFSWIYEMTPEGIKRESDVQRDESITRQTGRKMNLLVVTLLAIAIVMLAADRLIPETAAPTDTESAVEDMSIAVLPFANRSAQEDDVYFVDGIHDDILTQLARIGALTVTSRTSVEQYRNTTMSVPEIAAELGVRHILEGGVQRAGNRVRINMQLINAANDDHLWAETFDSELTAANIFDVQAEVAKAVTTALQATLQNDEVEALDARPTDSIEAYDLYLLGRYHWNQRTEESIQLAQDYFEQATQEDPDYVPALSGLADSYVLLVDYGNLGGDEAYPLAEEAVQAAMSLDDSVSEVWASLGLLRMNQLQNAEAEEALLRAIELDEKNFSAWNWYGIVLGNMARYAEAVEAFERAYSLEPLSIPVNSNLANYYSAKGDFVRARSHMERMTQLDPVRREQYRVRIAETYMNEGRLADAVQAFREILSNSPDNTRAMRGLALTRLFLGDRFKAREWYTRAEAISPFDVSRVRLYEIEGDYEASVQALEDLFTRTGNRRFPFALGQAFRASYLAGDLEQAAEYHRERLSYLNGRMDINPGDTQHFDALLVAEFVIAHGAAYGFDPDRGRAILDQVHAALVELRKQGYRSPETLASLAIANAMKGDVIEAVENLNESVDNGGRDPVYVSNYATFDALSQSPDSLALRERIASAVALENDRLAAVTLAEYDNSFEREPIALGREILAQYEGFYTDSNILLAMRLDENGVLTVKGGQQQPLIEALPFAEDQFFPSFDRSATMEFGRDENGTITHMLFRQSGGAQRFKVTAAPPEAIELPRSVLARYEGTYAYKRPSATATNESEADYWVGVVSVDDDGVVWLDLNDQPRLMLAPSAENEFFMPGFIGRFVFEFSASSEQASSISYYRDGMFYDFVRR